MRPLRTLIVLGLLVAGCGRTQIVAEDPGARIHADDVYLGSGRAEITRTGVSSTVRLRVEYPSGAVETRKVEREITGVSVVVGLFTYLTGLIWAQQYPERVAFPADPGAVGSSWSEAPGSNPWLQPNPAFASLPAKPATPLKGPE
jgi:hypothetical protein